MNREQAIKAKDDLDRLFGRGKHNHPGNFCWNDGIFAMSLVQNYGMSTSELAKQVKRVLAATSPLDKLPKVRAKSLRLKVCPFCGTKGKYGRCGQLWSDDEDRMWNASCPHGHAQSPDMDTQEAARDWWNRRHTGPAYEK